MSVKCNLRIKPMFGVIRANFGRRRVGNWTCYGAWHGGCYKEKNGCYFPYLIANDIDGSLIDDNLMRGDDKGRFREGRDGDSMIARFQFDTYYFLNIQRRMPDLQDDCNSLLLTCIRRFSLHSMWSQERSTVRANLYEGLCYMKVQAQLGLHLLNMMIAKATCIIITGYYGSFRGEKNGKTDLGEMRKYWKEAMDHPDIKHIPLILEGTLKGEDGVKLFVQPIIGITKKLWIILTSNTFC